MHNQSVTQPIPETMPFAWVRTASTVYLGETTGALPPKPWLEARFFTFGQELRLTPQGDYALVTYQETDCKMEETYIIENPRFGKEITVCQLLKTDGDGQSYIATTCLCDWKGV